MKIGLLAMSGVRAHEIRLLYLAAVTPPGHSIRYFETEADGAEPAAIYACDLVAISTFSAQVAEAYAIADRLRQAGVKVVMGGLHISVRPEEALQHADHVFLGEGENLWPAAVRAIEGGTTQRVWKGTDYPPVDIHALPVPRYDLRIGPG
jgi:hypothetical protein